MKKADLSKFLASLGLVLPQISHAFQVQSNANSQNRQNLIRNDRTLSSQSISSAAVQPSSPFSYELRSTATTSDATWNPAQASEFLCWNADDPEKAGKQLAPMIQHWGGNDVGEFLTRMYLGEVIQEEYKISYHPSNVRDPQWLGLGEDGLRFITLFFLEALPPQALEPTEITRFAEYFLLKEHKWPSSSKPTNGETNGPTNGERMFETDSFMKRGHGPDIARVFGYLRRERLGDFMADDVIEFINLPEQPDKTQILIKLGDFLGNLGIQMTSMEKIMTVEGLALQGCSPGLIARLVSSIEEIGEEVRLASVTKAETLREKADFPQTRPTNTNGETPSAKFKKSREWMSESIEAPIKSPLKEIVTEESESVGIGDFEARWLPDELLEEESKSR